MQHTRPASRRLVGRSLVGTFAVMIGISFAPANAVPPAAPDPMTGVWWEDVGPSGGRGADQPIAPPGPG